MKRMKQWLFPALTCLIVALAAVLPPMLSRAGDGQLGQVHAEALAAESLPVYEPPSLTDRLALYARWCTPSETIPSFRAPVILYDEDENTGIHLVQQALNGLAQAEVIPSYFSSASFTITSMDRILLWDPAVSAGRQEPMEFWAVMADWGDGSFWMRLDGESGLPLELSLYDPNMAKWLTYKDPGTLPELAERYLDLLGVEGEPLELDGPVDSAPWDRQFYVEEIDARCTVSFDGTMLNISLQADGAGAYGADFNG